MKNASLVALVFCLSVGVLKADILTVQVTSTVSIFRDHGSDGGYFGGGISVGDTLVMTYSYDTETTDSDARTNYGVYYQSIPNVLTINIGSYILQSNTDNLDYHISIVQGSTNDSYNVRSLNNTALGSAYTGNFDINWQINYDSGTLNSTDMLTTAPDISSPSYIQIGDDRDFYIVATPTSVEIIPEPITLLTFGLGGLIIRVKRSKGGML